MVTSVTDTTFDKIAEAVKAELARRAIQITRSLASPANPPRKCIRSRLSRPCEAEVNQGSEAVVLDGADGRGRARAYGGVGYRGRGYQSQMNRQGGPGDNRMPCFYCGKLGHFIRTCLVKQADEQSGAITKPFRVPFRGRRGGRQSMEFGRNGQRQYSSRTDDGWKQDDWMQRTSQDSRNQNSEYGPPAANVARINRYDSPDGVRNPQRGFHANTIRFRSTLAKIDERKSPPALIDSGATHNFFTRSRCS